MDLNPTQTTSPEQSEAIKEKEPLIFSTSASTLDAIDRCGMYFNYSKRLRIRPVTKKKGMDYGGLFHFMLHPYRFGLIKNVRDHHLEHPFSRLLGLERFNLIRICRELGRIKSMSTNLEAADREDCIERFGEYVMYYGPRDKFEVLEVEQPFSKILFESDTLVVLYEGIMDMLVLDPNWGQVPYDSKTASWGDEAETRNQFLGSCWAFGSDKFVIDKVFKRKEKPFERRVLSYMKESIDEWQQDAITTAMKGIQFLQNDFFPRQRFACDAKGQCDYLEACRTQPSSREFKIGAFYRKDVGEFDLYKKDHDLIRELLEHIMGPPMVEV